MLEFLGTALWASVAGYGLWRVSAVLERVGLAFVERLGDFKPIRESLAPPPPPNIPDDLAALAFNETEPWAKEEVLRAVREKYEEYHDWQKVRVAFGVARMPE
jgi:hypothetical protein